MDVLAKDSPGYLIGDGLAHHGCARIYQRLHRPSGLAGRCLSSLPIRVASSRHVTSDVENILGRAGQTRKRTVCGPFQIGRAVTAKGVKRVFHRRCWVGHDLAVSPSSRRATLCLSAFCFTLGGADPRYKSVRAGLGDFIHWANRCPLGSALLELGSSLYINRSMVDAQSADSIEEISRYPTNFQS